MLEQACAKALSYTKNLSYKTVKSVIPTIIFNNLYTRAGMLNVWKVDPVTRDSIAGATFNLKDADGNEPTLYHKPRTNEHSTDASSAEQEGFTEKVSSIVTGASGRFSVNRHQPRYGKCHLLPGRKPSLGL